MFYRKQQFVGMGQESCFLWGARQTGKSTLLRSLFPTAPYYDLLLSDEFERLSRRPSLLREELIASPPKHPVIVDEVQKIPLLLDEIQWLMVHHQVQFILSGSSARKLKRGGGNLLGGRALRYELLPLVYPEIKDFDLLRALNHGLLPRHYLAEDPRPLIRAYVGDYLKEEIAAEAIVRNMPAFSRFLEVAALSNGETVQYQNIARECGVSAPTVKEYFQVLEDTLLAGFVPAYKQRPNRRVIESPKFYFFDVGLVNFLLQRGMISAGGELFGRAFEHFVYQEIAAHRSYSQLHYPLAYWRTASQFEVDFILGLHEIAVEVKGVKEVQVHHLKGLEAFREEYNPRLSIVVSLDDRPRVYKDILILPWKVFLERLWSGELIH